MQDTAFVVWQNISGSGMLLALYVCASLFLFFREKERFKRILLVYLPALWIGILLLPFTYELVATFIDEELYYRFFWMLPMSLVIAYAAVEVYHLCQGKYKRLAIVGLVLCMILSGDFVYDNWRYSKAENVYHVPDSVVDICDLMHAEGREVMAAFPMDLLQYVRQYDSTICMPYGRNILVVNWGINHPLYEAIEAETVDLTILGEIAAMYNCAYVVLAEAKKCEGDLSGAGYVLKDTLHGYHIYYNDEIFHAIYN